MGLLGSKDFALPLESREPQGPTQKPCLAKPKKRPGLGEVLLDECPQARLGLGAPEDPVRGVESFLLLWCSVIYYGIV